MIFLKQIMSYAKPTAYSFRLFTTNSKSKLAIILLNPLLEKQIIRLLDLLGKYLQVKKIDLLLYDKQEQLVSFANKEHSRIIYDLCQKSILERKSICINLNKDGAENISSDLELNLGQNKLQTTTMLVPIITSEGRVGALYIKEPLYAKDFKSSDVQLAESFVSTFKIVFRKGMLYKSTLGIFSPIASSLILAKALFHCKYQLKKLNQRFTSIIAVSTLIHSTQEFNALIDSILRSARKVLYSQNASLFMKDKKTGEFYFQVISGKKDEHLIGKRIPQDKGVVGICAQKKQPIVVNDAIKDTRVYHQIEDSKTKFTRNLIAAPLLVDEECIGVIEVINTIDRPKFTEEDVFLFQAFSTSVAMAIHKRILLDNLKKANDELQNELNKTTALYAVSANLLTVNNKDKLFQTLITTVQQNLYINHICLLFYDKEKKELNPKTIIGFPTQDIWEYLPKELALHIYQNQESIVIPNTNDNDSFQDIIQNKTEHTIGSCMLFTLIDLQQESHYGLLYVADPKKDRFTQGDFDLFTSIITQTERAYQNIVLQEDFIQRRTLEKEIEIASTLQKELFPQVPLRHDYVDLRARTMMAKNMGGDLYHYHATDNNSPVTMLIGDVSGKSISAAFFMAVTSSIIKTIIQSETIPAKLLSKANDLIYKESTRGMFVTLFLASYSPEKKQLSYASAGHNQMILMRQDGSHDLLSGKGLPLGTMASSATRTYTNYQIDISPGDTLILYTDGITEAVNEQDEEFGLERLIHLLRNHKRDDTDRLIAFIFEELSKFSKKREIYDDLSLLVCHFPTSFKEKSYEFYLPATHDAIIDLIKKVETVLLEAKIEGTLSNDIILIVEEAVTNIVRHAYKGKTTGEKEEICLSIKIEAGHKIYLKFQDKGNSFDFPSTRLPSMESLLTGKVIGNLGIPIITAIADKVEYRRDNGVNSLLIEKIIAIPKNL